MIRRRALPLALGLALAGSQACTKQNKIEEEPPEAAPAPPAEPAPPPVVDTGDLDAVKKRGVLRVLTPSTEERFLPRQGLPMAADMELATAFAERLGVQAQVITVGSHSALLDELRAGHGDIIAAQLTATPSRREQVAFTAPTQTVSEWVVGAKGAEGLPRSAAELAGRAVHVRPSSAFAETLQELQKEVALEIVPVPEHLDTEQIIFAVSSGKRPLTVADDNLLAAVEAYNPNVERLFAVAKGRQLAWAVRKDNPKLLAAANAFIIEHNLTTHRRPAFTGDLAEIKERRVLRLLTRNNPVTYYLHRGTQRGFDYEIALMAAKRLGVRLEVVVPPSRDLLLPWLLEGRGDIVGAGLTITPERAAQVTFSEPYFYASEMVVQRKDTPLLQDLHALKGRSLLVRPSSSYHRTLSRLAPRFGPFSIQPAPEELETEQLITMVAEGKADLTVADSQILDLEITYGQNVVGALALPDPDLLPAAGDPQLASAGAEPPSKALEPQQYPIAFAMRPQNTELIAFTNAFVKSIYRGLEYNMARNRYFKNSKHIAAAKNERTSKTGQLSPYDALIKKYSERYGLDWRLMAAQAFQESRFDPQAESWVGAQGLFQVMPATGKELGFTNLKDPENSVHAGIKYMHQLISRMDPSIEFRQRLRFALAAYNAGYGHVLDAQRIAEQRGLDPHRWFGHVEQAMLLLEKPQYYRRARFGYCRGREPVTYVSNIQLYYSNYVELVPE